MKIHYLDMFSIVVYRIGFPDRPLLLFLFFVFKYKTASNIVSFYVTYFVLVVGLDDMAKIYITIYLKISVDTI